MRPRTLSASSIDSYAGCPARFEAEMARLRTDSAPGIFGTALHAALDEYIKALYFDDPSGQDGGAQARGHNQGLLMDWIWPQVAQEAFGFSSEWTEQGTVLLERWLATRPLPWRVLSREVKETFDLVVPGYNEVQPVTYICDRIDQHPDGAIEVIDYKSQWAKVSPTQMYGLIQPGLYACAMRRKYGIESVIVSFDLLRYEVITVPFTDTDLNSFESYLGAVAKRVWDDDAPVEKINSKCTYCIRKGVCGTLQTAETVGWTPTLPLETLVAIRNTSKDRIKGLESLITELDEVLLAKFEADETNVFNTAAFVVYANSKRSEKYDPEVVMRVLGDDALPFLVVGKTALDKELKKKAGRFSPEQVAAIKDMAQVTYGEPSIKIDAKGPVIDSE